MNDQDIIRIASQLSENLATKDDIKRLENKIDDLDQKVNKVLEFAEAVDETTTEIGQRVGRIESIPVIAHALKNPNS